MDFSGRPLREIRCLHPGIYRIVYRAFLANNFDKT